MLFVALGVSRWRAHTAVEESGTHLPVHSTWKSDDRRESNSRTSHDERPREVFDSAVQDESPRRHVR